MPFRLIVADLDGTLMGDDLVISPGVLAAVAKAKTQGLYFTVATGRVFQTALPFAQQLGVNAPIILYQGGEIRDIDTGRVIYRATVPLDCAREFISTVAALQLHLNVYLDDQVYVAEKTPELKWYTAFNPVDIHPVGDLLSFVDRPPNKMLIVAEPARLDEIAPDLREQFAGRLQIVRSHRRFLEAVPLGVDKGKGLARLAEYLGIAQEQTAAIGDNDNDAEMVAWAGLGIAMGNGSEAVKHAADVIAAPLDQDGAAWSILTQTLDLELEDELDDKRVSFCSIPQDRDAMLHPADDPAGIQRAVELLQNGGLVAFPTDTVYGIGADARQPDAVSEIYVAKRRSPDKAMPLLVASLEDVKPFVSSIPEAAHRLIDTFWPGGLTLVLPIAPGVPAVLSPGSGIAVRMPDHPVALELIRRLGAPLAATSANVSGKPDTLTAREVLEQLGRRVDLVLDGGQTSGMQPSTVVDLTTTPARLLRAGPISMEQLREYIPDLDRLGL